MASGVIYIIPLNFVRKHHCSIEGCIGMPIEAAHVRKGSGAGMGQKPDDWRAVSLCRDHHQAQHTLGEQTFWEGRDVEGLIAAFCKASPKAQEIKRARERGNGSGFHQAGGRVAASPGETGY